MNMNIDGRDHAKNVLNHFPILTDFFFETASRAYRKFMTVNLPATKVTR